MRCSLAQTVFHLTWNSQAGQTSLEGGAVIHKVTRGRLGARSATAVMPQQQAACKMLGVAGGTIHVTAALPAGSSSLKWWLGRLSPGLQLARNWWCCGGRQAIRAVPEWPTSQSIGAGGAEAKGRPPEKC